MALALSVTVASMTPLRAAGQDPASPALGAAQTRSLVEQWQQDIAAAKLRRTKARQLEAGGFLVAIGADILAGLIVSKCRSGDCALAPVVGLTGLGVGIGMGLTGRARAQDANVEIEALLVRGPKGGQGVAIPIGDAASVSVTVGHTNSIAWHLRW